MALVVIGLAIFLVWSLAEDIYAAIVKRRLRKRIHEEHCYWVEKRKEFAREALR